MIDYITGLRENWNCPGCGQLAPNLVQLPRVDADATDLLLVGMQGGLHEFLPGQSDHYHCPGISYDVMVLEVNYTLLAVMYCSPTRHYTAAARIHGQWHFYDDMENSGRTTPLAGLHAVRASENGMHCLLVYGPKHAIPAGEMEAAAVRARGVLLQSRLLSSNMQRRVSNLEGHGSAAD